MNLPFGPNILSHATHASIWSASLPAIFGQPARAWNGHTLTEGECYRALLAYIEGGPQYAVEWLSEHVGPRSEAEELTDYYRLHTDGSAR